MSKRRMYRHIGAVMSLAALMFAAGCGQGGDPSDPFGPAIARIGDAVVAEVNGTPIYDSDVKREAIAQGLVEAADPLDPDGQLFAEVLDELIQRRIFALEARRRDLHETQEARRRIASARELILYNIIVETVIDDAVTEDALRTLFDEQVKLRPLGDEVRVRHIVSETPEEATLIAQMAREGSDEFAQLALQHSTDDATRFEGGDLGYFARGEIIIPEIEAVAFDTPVGAISEPFESELGWHVIKVEDRRAEEPPTFEEMRPDLVRFLTYQELDKLTDVLQSNAEITRSAGVRSSQ